MVKAFGATITTTEALIGGSFAAEALTGQIELIAAEAAIVGAVMLYKHFKKKRQEKAN
jgi:hypothetical protein